MLSGLVLDVAIAAAFGAGRATDAFFVAARIPLGLVAIVLVGANQALVPAISNWLVKKGEDETWRLVSILLNATLILGGVLSAVLALGAEPLMRVTAPGLSEADIALATSIARIMFFVVPLTMAAELLRALLNARYSFVVPAAMHVVLNVVAAGLVIGNGGRDIHWVAWAYLIGSVVQLAFMLVSCFRHGYRYRSTMAIRDKDVVRVAKLSTRPLIGAGLNPLARIGEQLFVSFLPTGSITILNYGSRLVHAIGGSVLFRSVMVAIIPRLTEATTLGKQDEIKRITRLGVRILLTVSIPLTAFMAVLASPAARAVFRRGDFSRADAALLGAVLAVFAASLVGSAFQRSLMAPFFARLDTRMPLRNTIYGIVANLALLPILVLPFGFDDSEAVLGVAAAYSLAQYVNVAHAWYRMRRDIGVKLRSLRPTVVRLSASSGAAAAVMYAGYRYLELGEPAQRWVLLGKTAVVGAAGLLVFGAMVALLAGKELKEMWSSFRKGKKRQAPDTESIVEVAAGGPEKP